MASIQWCTFSKPPTTVLCTQYSTVRCTSITCSQCMMLIAMCAIDSIYSTNKAGAGDILWHCMYICTHVSYTTVSTRVWSEAVQKKVSRISALWICWPYCAKYYTNWRQHTHIHWKTLQTHFVLSPVPPYSFLRQSENEWQAYSKYTTSLEHHTNMLHVTKHQLATHWIHG